MRTLLLKITLGLIFFVGTSLTALAQPMINTQDVSNPNSCDGAAWFSDSTMNSTTIFWQGNGTVLQQGGYGITGLCAGTYTVTYQDAGGNNITLTFIISATNDPCAGFYTVGQSTDVSAAGMCDGTAWMTTTGGTAPYTYTWSPGGQTVPQAGGLCEGTYTIVTVDANGCAYTEQITIGNGANTVDSTIIINNGTPNGGVIDTLGNITLDDCVIDITTIDSVYVNGVITGVDSVTVTWVVIDTLGVTVQTYTVSYPSPNTAGNYSVVITITCPQRASGINTLVAYDYVELQEASVNDVQFEKLRVINPFNDELIISGLEAGWDLMVTDMSGRVVHQSNVESKVTSINSNAWSNGMYIIHVMDNNGAMIDMKVIK
jgi:hypothetical protein